MEPRRYHCQGAIPYLLEWKALGPGRELALVAEQIEGAQVVEAGEEQEVERAFFYADPEVHRPWPRRLSRRVPPAFERLCSESVGRHRQRNYPPNPVGFARLGGLRGEARQGARLG